MSVPEQSAIQKQQARIAKSLANGGKQSTVTPEHKALIPQLIADGATLTWLADQAGMPGAGAILRARDNDPAFADAMRAAFGANATVGLDAAHQYATDAIDDVDIDKAKRADILHRIAVARAEKIAPREFGAMIKHADADGGKLTVSVINYAAPTPDAETR